MEGSECMLLEWETVDLIEPEIAVDFEGVAAVTNTNLRRSRLWPCRP